MESHYTEQGDRFRVLFVCTGNICRSPFAEILTRHLLIGRLGGRAADAYELSSAGVRAVEGSGMHPYSREQLTPWGLYERAGQFEARQLTSAMLHEADLILGATSRHRSAAIEQAPEALSKAFSLRELARLVAAVSPSELPADPPDRGRVFVKLARNQRGLLPIPAENDEIPDPMGLPMDAHRRAAGLMFDAARRIVDALVPAAPAFRPPPAVLRAAQTVASCSDPAPR